MIRNVLAAAFALAAATFVVPANAQDAGPVLAVIAHPVEDYEKWRVAYDAFEEARKEAGVTGAEVFQSPSDPNQVIVIHRFPDLDAANNFLGSEELKSVMQDAGVAAPPDVIIAVKSE